MDVDVCCIISLARRRDRLARFMARVPRKWPFPSIEVVSAVDGSRCFPPDGWLSTDGAWGCYRSHLRVIESALTHGAQTLLVFEDDAVLVDGFEVKAPRFLRALPSDWQMAYLGGEHVQLPREVSDGVWRVTATKRTHCYALRGSAMARIYGYLCAHPIDEVDELLVRAISARGIMAYCPPPGEWLVEQDPAGGSDINAGGVVR